MLALQSINLNLAISNAFQTPEWGKLVFPGKLYIELVPFFVVRESETDPPAFDSYVRVFQKGTPNVGCDPASHREHPLTCRLEEAY